MSDSNIAGNILKILSGLPEFLRKPMLKNRLMEFFSLSEQDRKETVTNALTAAPTIEFEVLANLVRTWMELLCEFDEDKRRAMFRAYVDVIAASPEILAKLNIDALLSVFVSLPTDKGQMLAGSLQGLMNDLPADKRARVIGAIPENAKHVLKIT